MFLAYVCGILLGERRGKMNTRMDNEWAKFTTDSDGDVAIRTIESVDFFQAIADCVIVDSGHPREDGMLLQPLAVLVHFQGF